MLVCILLLLHKWLGWTPLQQFGSNCKNTTFQNEIRGRVKKLKLQLRTLKCDKSVSMYLLDIKKTVDTLVVIGSPITTEDHIDTILDGLPNEYDSFASIITSHLDPYIVVDVEFFAQEDRLDKQISSDNFLQANAATRNSINQSCAIILLQNFQNSVAVKPTQRIQDLLILEIKIRITGIQMVLHHLKT